MEQLIGTPRGPLAKRFGRGLHRRLDQALGNLAEPIEPVFPEHLSRARRGFMEPIATPEAFARVIGDLSADVVDQLTRTSSGARRLDCLFHRVDGHVQAVRVTTVAPSRDAAHLDDLSPLLASVGGRTDFADVYGVSRADVVKHGMGPDPRDPAERPLGKRAARHLYPRPAAGIRHHPGEPADGIKVRTRDFR